MKENYQPFNPYSCSINREFEIVDVLFVGELDKAAAIKYAQYSYPQIKGIILKVIEDPENEFNLISLK